MLKKRTYRILTGLVAATILLGLLANVVYRKAFEEEYERFRQVQIGMTETEVVALLGDPQRVFIKDTAPENYYVDGYSFKKRLITGKVLIYVGAEPIAYVYLDNKSVVEYVFIGGS